MKLQKSIAAQKEPTIALINVVFLMLIFFMITGTLAPPMDGDVKLIQTEGLEGHEPPDTLVVHGDGRLSLRGVPVADAESFMTGLKDEEKETLRLVPDRDLPAAGLVQLANTLRGLGAGRVVLISERALH